jgi:hypothetical protein
MGKVTFWMMVAVAAIIGIYLFKMVAAASNVDGLKTFAAAI